MLFENEDQNQERGKKDDSQKSKYSSTSQAQLEQASEHQKSRTLQAFVAVAVSPRKGFDLYCELLVNRCDVLDVEIVVLPSVLSELFGQRRVARW